MGFSTKGQELIKKYLIMIFFLIFELSKMMLGPLLGKWYGPKGPTSPKSVRS
jgi:hypothetical protein